MVAVRLQLIGLWACPVGAVLLCAAFLVGSAWPIPSPNHDPAYIAAFYTEHANGIRLMAVLFAASVALFLPLYAVLCVQLKRIEGAEVLAYAQLAAGAGSTVALTIPCFFWETAAFRPDRDPMITQSWHDAAWLCLVAGIFIAAIEIAVTALAILNDEKGNPVFPRWLGYVSIFAALLLMPGPLCLWFKTGPFAWNGIFTIYLVFTAIGIWFTAVTVCLFKVVLRQRRQLV